MSSTSVEFKTAAAKNSMQGRDIIIAQGGKGPELRKLQSDHTWALNRLTHAEELVKNIENQLGLLESWTPDSPEYIQTAVLISNAKDLKAIDNLEQLVVQRLFELTKMNLSGTGKYCIFSIPI
jgi:hypothetical protein